MASDKHLDAEWKRIQKKTFTRWCNEHLKLQKGLKISELSDDLKDGVRLVVLLEMLSQKKLGRYNKKPRVHAQRMENVQTALDFIMKAERIRLVNIGKTIFIRPYNYLQSPFIGGLVTTGGHNYTLCWSWRQQAWWNTKPCDMWRSSFLLDYSNYSVLPPSCNE